MNGNTRRTNHAGGLGSRSNGATVCRESQDVFAEARALYTIPELWIALSLHGEPKPSCRSPFREERNPSFSIFDEGRGWKDHGTGEGGDVVSFIMAALKCDHSAARAWFMARLGIGHHDSARALPPSRPEKAPEGIQWPQGKTPGTAETWQAFATKRRLHPVAVSALAKLGFLYFLRIDGIRCFALAGPKGRVGEIRRIDGGLFASGSKVYPLRGIDKLFPLGWELLSESGRGKPILLCEGSSDWLAAVGAYACHIRGGGSSWVPLAFLGAACRKAHPEVIAYLRARRVRIFPDGDKPGRAYAEAWRDELLDAGCTVEIVATPKGRDLRDLLESGELKPTELFR